jgi:hypothetical protein
MFPSEFSGHDPGAFAIIAILIMATTVLRMTAS